MNNTHRIPIILLICLIFSGSVLTAQDLRVQTTTDYFAGKDSILTGIYLDFHRLELVGWLSTQLKSGKAKAYEHPSRKEMADIATFLSELKDEGLISELGFIEQWDLRGDEPKVEFEMLSIHIADPFDPDLDHGEYFFEFSMTNIPSEIFILRGPFGSARPSNPKTLFKENLIRRRILAYEEPGAEKWESLDTKVSELQEKLELSKVDKIAALNAKKKKYDEVRFGAVADPYNSLIEEYYWKDYTYLTFDDFELNRLFGTEIITPVMEKVLEGEITAYDGWDLVNYGRLTEIEDPVKKFDDLLVEDDWDAFGDPGWKELLTKREKHSRLHTMTSYWEVVGTMSKKGKGVVFKPEYLMLNWLDPGETYPMNLYGAVKLSDIKMDFQGMSVKKFLASDGYRRILTEIESIGIRDVPESVMLNEVLWSGEWEKFPTEAELRAFRGLEDSARLKYVASKVTKPNLPPIQIQYEDEMEICIGFQSDTTNDRFRYTYQKGFNYQSLREFEILEKLSKEVVVPTIEKVIAEELELYNIGEYRFDRSMTRFDQRRRFVMTAFDDWGFDDGDVLDSDMEKEIQDKLSRREDAVLQCAEYSEVVGTLKRKKGTVTFEPKYLNIVWSDPGEVLPKINVGFVELEKIGIEFEGKSLVEWFADLHFPYVMIWANRIATRSGNEGLWIDAILESGYWEALPGGRARSDFIKLGHEKQLELIRTASK